MTQDIKFFTKTEVNQIRNKMVEAAKAVGAEYGLNVTNNGGVFYPTDFSFKIEVSVIGDDGIADTREAQAFRQHSSFDGIPHSALGKTYGGYTFIGYKTRAKKRPYQVRNIKNNTDYSAPILDAKRLYAMGEDL